MKISSRSSTALIVQSEMCQLLKAVVTGLILVVIRVMCIAHDVYSRLHILTSIAMQEGQLLTCRVITQNACMTWAEWEPLGSEYLCNVRVNVSTRKI